MCIVVFRWQAHQLYPLILFNNRDKCELPLLFLKSKSIPREFGEDLKTEAENYNGFNLVVGDIESKSMVYMSNRGKKAQGGRFYIEEVRQGLHVLSNAQLDSPSPKSEHLRFCFHQELATFQLGILYFSGVIIVLSKRMCVKPESLLI
ncbi:hypothetical protein K1719_031864 [Acacia pycnantha]|nr:hypothetical protein K1719_031864 [Acacia pycnantha]